MDSLVPTGLPDATALAVAAVALVLGMAFSRALSRRRGVARPPTDPGKPTGRPPTRADPRALGDEARMVGRNRHVLVILTDPKAPVLPMQDRLNVLAENMFGSVARGTTLADIPIGDTQAKTVYLCGHLSPTALARHASPSGLAHARRVLVIKQLANGYGATATQLKLNWPTVDLGRVPVSVHGVGVYYRRFFGAETANPDRPAPSYFQRISEEHAFQSLTESTKPGTALRTGLYLTDVEQRGPAKHFRLLRCSSNFSGPTVNFSATDRSIVEGLNEEAEHIFEGHSALNHVLAQVYHNRTKPAPLGATAAQPKQTKAKIKAHADKTKDMPAGGIMAFCTFYDAEELQSRLQPEQVQPRSNRSSKGARPDPLAQLGDGFDFCHRGISGLTQLHFRLKPCVEKRQRAADKHGRDLPSSFSVTLYPDSVFFMPLWTNRLYTHEIRPGRLDAGLLPTRMGYVVRCANCEAVWRPTPSRQPAASIPGADRGGSHTHDSLEGGQTYILKASGIFSPLQPPTAEGITELRRQYAEENSSDAPMFYGDVPFSMNKGDYMAPLLGEDCGGSSSPGPSGANRSQSAPPSGHRKGVRAGTDPATAARHGFHTFSIPDGWHHASTTDGNGAGTDALSVFDSLRSSCEQWEATGKGREGAVLVRPDHARGTPIVRTTTRYDRPAQCFRPVHHQLVGAVSAVAAGFKTMRLDFNNALIECYSNAYTKMGFHSDQALDLADGTYIVVASFYERHGPEEMAMPPPRKLVVEAKGNGQPATSTAHPSRFEVPLAHNSVVMWSLETNRCFRHKIVLDGPAHNRAENRWLGVTLRMSRTFVHAARNATLFEDETPLSLADDGRVREFRRMRRRENDEVSFCYPSVDYTTSPSDLMQPVP